jgi:hypothetical protein
MHNSFGVFSVGMGLRMCVIVKIFRYLNLMKIILLRTDQKTSKATKPHPIWKSGGKKRRENGELVGFAYTPTISYAAMSNRFARMVKTMPYGTLIGVMNFGAIALVI